MELHFLVLRERKNIILARRISMRQRGAVMAFIPDHEAASKEHTHGNGNFNAVHLGYGGTFC